MASYGKKLFFLTLSNTGDWFIGISFTFSPVQPVPSYFYWVIKQINRIKQDYSAEFGHGGWDSQQSEKKGSQSSSTEHSAR